MFLSLHLVVLDLEQILEIWLSSVFYNLTFCWHWHCLFIIYCPAAQAFNILLSMCLCCSYIAIFIDIIIVLLSCRLQTLWSPKVCTSLYADIFHTTKGCQNISCWYPLPLFLQIFLHNTNFSIPTFSVNMSHILDVSILFVVRWHDIRG